MNKEWWQIEGENEWRIAYIVVVAEHMKEPMDFWVTGWLDTQKGSK
jgi:hypothetical protein